MNPFNCLIWKCNVALRMENVVPHFLLFKLSKDGQVKA